MWFTWFVQGPWEPCHRVTSGMEHPPLLGTGSGATSPIRTGRASPRKCTTLRNGTGAGSSTSTSQNSPARLTSSRYGSTVLSRRRVLIVRPDCSELRRLSSTGSQQQSRAGRVKTTYELDFTDRCMGRLLPRLAHCRNLHLPHFLSPCKLWHLVRGSNALAVYKVTTPTYGEVGTWIMTFCSFGLSGRRLSFVRRRSLAIDKPRDCLFVHEDLFIHLGSPVAPKDTEIIMPPKPKHVLLRIKTVFSWPETQTQGLKHDKTHEGTNKVNRKSNPRVTIHFMLS